MTEAKPMAFKATFADWRPPFKRGRSSTETLEAYSIPVTECGCWIWLGAGGIAARYGTAYTEGLRIKAHHLSWIVHHGQIPDGLCVLHECDVPLCVNPDHLFLGTQKDNTVDREKKGRGNHAAGLRNGRHTKPERTSKGDLHYTRLNPGIKQGVNNGRAKLVVQDIIAIRANHASASIIGKQYGVTKTTILRIKKRKLWSHIND